jgi:DNA-binding CsgD family transcriptional regulator
VGDALCPVLVGREAELSALDAALTAARRGSGRLVFLTGEPGIGKSRLARELADRARSQGAVVITGRAVPAGTSTPYRPLTEALLQALRERPLPTDGDLGPWLPALGMIVPVGAGEGAPPGIDAGEPASLAAGAAGTPTTLRGEAVLRLLRWLAPPGGLVMVLEDLHWADPDTLAVVEYLGDNLGGQPVLCVATGRDEPTTAALEMTRRLHARRAAGHLMLDRLDGTQVAAMVQACVPNADEETVRRVRRTADGVPFLVEEVLASPGVPASFRDMVRARLAGVGEDERLVLTAGAVLGRHFDWRLLTEATGQPLEVVSRALERGVDQLLLTVDGEEFRFRHALTREAVAAAILPPRRQALAAAALAVYEEAHPGLPGQYRDVGADLAQQAGDQVRAGQLLAKSGRAALDRGALATAVDTLCRAADLLRDSPERDAAEASRVEALALAGRVDEAMAAGADLIARLDGGRPTARARTQIHLRLAHAAVAATRWPAVARHLAAAAELLATAPDPMLSAQVMVLEADVAMAADDLDRARRLADSVLDGRAASPEVRCHALEIVGRSQRLRDLDAARRAFEEALSIAESGRLPFWRLRALHELGTIELFDHVGTRRLSQARQMAGELGALSTAAVLDLQLAAAADCRYDLDELERLAADSLAISERLGLGLVQAKALLFLCEGRALRADREGTEHYAARALAAADGDPEIEAFAVGAGRAMRALLDGDQAGALEEFERSAAILRRCPNAEPANFRGVRLLVLTAAGDDGAAAEIQAAHAAGLTRVFVNRGMAEYAEAILAGRAGDRALAGQRAAAAEQHLAPYPVWTDLGRMYAAEAALAGRWGDPARWLREAGESFAAHGFGRLAKRCLDALAAVGPDPWAVFGVTAREADVLRLLSGGLGNKEIAARLYLSPRTVEKHIESLLRKTGARSRTQLAVIADRGLGGTT